jgi:hypothetical protein
MRGQVELDLLQYRLPTQKEPMYLLLVPIYKNKNFAKSFFIIYRLGANLTFDYK